MDYQKELDRLKEQETALSTAFWKPEAGQHKVKALAELEDGDPYEEEGKEPQLRKWLRILTDGKEHTWSMPSGKTSASTYGQLVSLGVKRKGLANQEFIVVVVGQGQNKRFTIVG